LEARRARRVTWKEEAAIIPPLNERMNRVAVDLDGGDHRLAAVIAQCARLVHRQRAALHSLGARIARVLYPERDIADAVAVLLNVVGDVASGAQRRREKNANLVLLQQVRRSIARSCFGSAITDELKAERALIVVGRLLRVTHIELDVVGAVDREDVVAFGLRWRGSGSGHLQHSWYRGLLD